MDFVEIGEHDTDAVGFNQASVDVEFEIGMQRHWVGEGCLEIGSRAKELLVGLRLAHDQLVITAAGHDAEAVSACFALYLAKVEVERPRVVNQIHQRMGFVGREKVHAQQVGRARRKGQDGNAGVAQFVGDRGHCAVPAAGDDEIETLGILQQLGKLHRGIERSDGDGVPGNGVLAHEVEDGIVAHARGYVANHEYIHGACLSSVNIGAHSNPKTMPASHVSAKHTQAARWLSLRKCLARRTSRGPRTALLSGLIASCESDAAAHP